MISFPIPENPKHTGVTTSFDSLGGKGSRNIGSSLRRLTSGRRRLVFDLTQKVHLDPDIRPEIRPRNQHNPECYYGQNGSSQTSLEKGGVCNSSNNSLFLFYGWYRGVTDDGAGSLRYLSYKADDSLSHDQHVIWGWLQVESAHTDDLARTLPCADHHPHIEHSERKRNCVYVGKQLLTFDPAKPGAGTFLKYHPDLRLTCPDESKRMSHWKVPPFLRRTAVGGIRTQWSAQPHDARTLVYKGFGQEFIFEVDQVDCKAELGEWLSTLFRHA